MSSNPNATVNGETWLRSWPAFIFNMRPTCQTNTLPVGSQFFTNHTGLLYTLNSIWQQNQGSSSFSLLPGLIYYNNVLENYSVSVVEIEIESYDRTAKQVTYSMWGDTVRTFAMCSFLSAQGRTWFNIPQKYGYVPESLLDPTFWGEYQFLGTNFLERNETTKPALW